MFKLNQLIVGIFLFLSSLFSCQQKGDFQSMNVEEFDSLIQNEDIQRLDVRTLAEYSEGHITKTININVMDDSFASMADSLLQKDKPVAVYCRSGKRSKKAAAILSEKGYKVFELDKGFNSWEEAGKEIENKVLIYQHFIFGVISVLPIIFSERQLPRFHGWQLPESQ